MRTATSCAVMSILALTTLRMTQTVIYFAPKQILVLTMLAMIATQTAFALIKTVVRTIRRTTWIATAYVAT
jgi:hypothetical protein